ncbi:zinc-dependent alcohol dehydrogenase family protein [Betaproteobacteria bacterium SCN2]|jgi:NADPH2:quinone reductase|nr:zinc-dependent alcohol dehydrogenase family protein [Betaproteobacteria bacterium SCN2]
MKAILMTAPGAPEVLSLADVSVPAISHDTDLLVRLKATGVNPIDIKLRAKGTFFPERMPAILGCDGAGVVEAVGSGASRFKPGDAVYFCNGGIGGHPGNYAEYAVVDERFAARKPASLDFNQAAAAPLVLITAWEALYDRARMTAGQTVLVHAGAGGVGHVAIQLAKTAGCRVLTTIGSPDKAAFVKQLGADEAIPYRDTDFVKAVLELTGGQGADIVFDTVGGATFQNSFAAVRAYGDLVTLLQPRPETDWKIARLRNLRVAQELMLSPMFYGWVEAQQHQAWILEQCAALFDANKLRVEVNKVLPLEDAAEAHRLIEAGGMRGKLVLAIN